jgi:sulfite exporter TauE/SafE
LTDAYSPLADHSLGVQMNLGRVASIVIAIVAVVGVFVEIPIVSDYAFWIMAGAYLVWVGVHYDGNKSKKK